MTIQRDLYLSKLILYKDKELVKIITGIRRCGKSVLLFEIFYNYLLSQNVPENHIIKLSLDFIGNKKYRTAENLYEFIKEKITDNARYYILLDEIQFVEDFEEAVNGIKGEFNCDVYITGSNSKLLSSDINTKFRGRGIEIKVFPLSFKEFYSFYKSKEDKETCFNNYVKYGGLPYLLQTQTESEKKEYLEMISSSVADRDLIEHYKIRNQKIFEAVIEFLCSNIGSYVSSSKIANTLKSNGFKTVDNETVSNYLKYVCDAFLFYKVNRYDIKGKEYLKTQNKYYICDMGLRNARLEYRQIEMTHIIENLVYLELLRQGFTVYIGKNENKEIDFIAEKQEILNYIQVSLTIENPETKKRELSAFSKLDDGYKKIIITMDKNPLRNLEKGYIQINLFDFLLQDNCISES